MTTVAGRIVIALALFAAAFACITEARNARRVADVYARLATLQYEAVANLEADGEPGWQLPTPFGSLAIEQSTHRLTASYWQEEFGVLTNPIELSETAGAQAAADPLLLFVAANAAFRSTEARSAGEDDRASVVEHLDRVVQAYADVLREAPEYSDASFNYEYVSRFRDAIASGTRRPAASAGFPVISSPDLPTGPTLHGPPGGPPAEIPGSDFRTIAPMPYDEREETDPGLGAPQRRRG